MAEHKGSLLVMMIKGVLENRGVSQVRQENGCLMEYVCVCVC